MDVAKISGIGEFTKTIEKDGEVTREVYAVPDGKAFLVVRAKTYEVRSDRKLADKLREDYESVMESRYFGRNGLEIVPCGQLPEDEVEDLIRLSYNLTKELEEDA